jgi:hypothetical protein
MSSPANIFVTYIKDETRHETDVINDLIQITLENTAMHSHYLSYKIDLRPHIKEEFQIATRIAIQKQVRKINTSHYGLQKTVPRRPLAIDSDLNTESELELELVIRSNYIKRHFYVEVLYEKSFTPAFFSKAAHMKYIKIAQQIFPDQKPNCQRSPSIHKHKSKSTTSSPNSPKPHSSGSQSDPDYAHPRNLAIHLSRKSTPITIDENPNDDYSTPIPITKQSQVCRMFKGKFF